MSDIERSLTYLEAQVKYLMQRDGEREGSAMAKPSLTTDPVTNALATLSAYNAAHPDAPMTWWPGGDKAPEDWDGGKVLFKTGVTGNVAGRWPAIIGYHQKAEAPEPAADPVNDPAVQEAWREMLASGGISKLATFLDALAKRGLRLVRDLSGEERRELAGKVYAEFVYGSNPDFTDTDLAHAAIDAALGPVKS